MFSILVSGIVWQVVKLVFRKIDIGKTTGLYRTLRGERAFLFLLLHFRLLHSSLPVGPLRCCQNLKQKPSTS